MLVTVDEEVSEPVTTGSREENNETAGRQARAALDLFTIPLRSAGEDWNVAEKNDQLNFVRGAAGGGVGSGRSRGRRRAQSTSGTASVPRYPGMHYVEIWVGSPLAQRLTLAVSTSSDFTVFPCTAGSAEEDWVVPFDSSKSETFSIVGCESCYINDGCGNGADRCEVSGTLLGPNNSWRAYEARDTIYIGGSPLERQDDGDSLGNEVRLHHLLGCEMSKTGFLENIRKSANGILGMSTSRNSFINQLFATGKLTKWQFSLCFNRQFYVNGTNPAKTESGTMTLGGYEPLHLTTPMVYAKNTKQNGAPYSVYISGMYLRKGGGQSVLPDTPNQEVERLDIDLEALNKGAGVVLDSASPYTLFDNIVERAFQELWTEMAGLNHTMKSIPLNDEQLLSLPTVLVQFKADYSGKEMANFDPDRTPGMVGTVLDPVSPRDVLLAIPATHYMEYLPSSRMYRNRISLKNDGVTILGANVLQGRQVNFDLTNQRIGFSEQKTCNGEKKDESPNDTSPSLVDGFIPAQPPPGQEGKVPELQEGNVPKLKAQTTYKPTVAPTQIPTNTLAADVRLDTVPNAMITPDMSFSFDEFYLGAAAFLLLVSLVLIVIATCRNKREGTGSEGEPLGIDNEEVEYR